MQQVKSIKAYGTRGLCKGDEFTAKPDGNGGYKLFPVGSNKLDAVETVNDLNQVLPYVSRGYKIRLTSLTSTSQRSLNKCIIEYK